MPARRLALAILLAALVLRLGVFHSYAAAWDPCEYALAVRDRYLPHSPYVLYLWLGLLLEPPFGAELGLSLLSLLGGLLSIGLLGWIVARQAGRAAPGLAAAALYAVFPVGVWFSGLQEVYAPHAALLLGALAAAQRGRALAAGLLFGAALALHSGGLFLLPALLLALLLPAPAGRRTALARRAALGALVVPGAAAVWLLAVFHSAGRSSAGWLDYLRGMAPAPGLASPSALLRTGPLHVEGIAQVTLGAAVPMLLLLALAVAALLRSRHGGLALPWLAWALPYSAYECGLGLNLDPGVYLVYTAPALAALIGLGLDAALRALGGPGAVMVPAILALALAPARTSWEQRRQVVPRAEFLARPELRAARWIREHLPPGTRVVVPSGSSNANLLPFHARRPFLMPVKGRWQSFSGGRWTPLWPDSFRPVTAGSLAALRAEGHAIVALEPEPSLSSGTGLAWSPRSLAPGDPGVSLWFLEPVASLPPVGPAIEVDPQDAGGAEHPGHERQEQRPGQEQRRP